MIRSTLLYLSLCLFYTAFLVWLEAPKVGFLEVDLRIEGIAGGPIVWVLLGLGLPYAALSVPSNARVLHQVSKLEAFHVRLALLAAAFVMVPGSMGIIFYFLTGSPYVALPFDALMLLLTPYYYWHLYRLLSHPATDGITP